MLELYYSETCPFCQKVIGFLREHDIEFEPKEVLNRDFYNELMTLGGIAQVPFLHDTETGTTMYESADIIEYVKNLIK